MQQLNNEYATPNQLPIVAAYNLVETQGGGCCIIGYHSAYARTGGTQTYAVGADTDPGEFSASGIRDIHAWSHEIGEWMDDPFVDNATAAWGHTGQVSGCQNNLEVGDPLTGIPYTVTLNGFTYHPQELGFNSWFLPDARHRHRRGVFIQRHFRDGPRSLQRLMGDLLASGRD